MPDSASPDLHDLLAGYLGAEKAARDIAAYFAEPGESTKLEDTYTGRHFERIAGGGDRPDIAHRITAEDLVAVQALSVTVGPETSVQLLEGHLGLAVNRLLRDIPTTVSIFDAAARRHLAAGSPADRCWQLLVSDAAPGIGATTAGKLLARKRPHLVPVYDDVVRCALRRPSSLWVSLHRAFGEHPELLQALDALRSQAPQHVSAIRVLDVVVWMAHESQHRTACKTGRLTESNG